MARCDTPRAVDDLRRDPCSENQLWSDGMTKRRNNTPKEPHDRELLIALLGFLSAVIEFVSKF
jgi:hypothetical protein